MLLLCYIKVNTIKSCGHLNVVKNKGNGQLIFPKSSSISFTMVVARGLHLGEQGSKMKIVVTRTFQTVLS